MRLDTEGQSARGNGRSTDKMLGPGYTKGKRDQVTVILPTDFKCCEITLSLVMHLAETSFRDMHII